jgi:hypothetical protein
MKTSFKLYIESFFGLREPVFEVYVNDNLLLAEHVDLVELTKHGKKEIYSFITWFNETSNIIKIRQIDKTDRDLFFVGDTFIDHYIKIREIEIDNIKFETALYFSNSTFCHYQSDEWVSDMALKGYKIEKLIHNQTDIRLNGEWCLEFSFPVWKWVTEHMIDFNNE